MTPWSGILDVLSTATITDLLVPVWLDRKTSPPRADLLFSQIYLELANDRGFLQLTSVNSHGGLAWDHVAVPDLSEQILAGDDPADHCLASLASQYFGECSTVICRAVTYTTNEESDLDQGIVRCAELLITADQRIFFDPMWTAGIRIGLAGAAERWMEEYEDGPWTMQQHYWTPPA